LGEEIALLMMILAATTVAAIPQQKTEAPSCPAGVILVSKTAKPDLESQANVTIPRAEADLKGPAVLMPACKPDGGKKKDYPLA
jgi:hypothetical protein